MEPDPGLVTIRAGVLLLAVAATALVAWYTLVRRSALDTTARWILAVAFLVLSPLVYALSFALSLNGSKPVAFCNSCHIMEPYVADLENPDSEHLAALHFQYRWIANDQCYTCHSDYGLFGGVDAKLAGLRHMWFYYVAGWETPIKIRGTYDNDRCLHCHGPVKGYREVPVHKKHEPAIDASEMSCLGGKCHVSPHPKEAAEGGGAAHAS
jgi:hypothetical protein